MYEGKSIIKNLSKKLKENKSDEKKIFNFNLKKSTIKNNNLNAVNSNKININKNDLKNITNDKLKEHEKNGEDDKTIKRDIINLNKQNSSENKSFSENDVSEYDDEWRNLNELFHILLNNSNPIDSTNELNRKFSSIKDFMDEHFLNKTILDIEPKFYEINGLTDKLLNDYGDNSFSIKYGNFISLLKALNEYFKNSPENYRFSRNLNINNMINLNEFLREDQTQIMILSELTLILFSISTQKDLYLDIINNSEQNVINNFLYFLEKYLFFDIRDESVNIYHQNSDELINNFNLKNNSNNLNASNNIHEATYNIQNISNIINLNNQLSSNILNSAEGKEKNSDNYVLDEITLMKGNSYKSVSQVVDNVLNRKISTSINLVKIKLDSVHGQPLDFENKTNNKELSSNNNSNDINAQNTLNNTGIFHKTKTKTFIKKMNFEENEKKKLLSIIELLKKEVSNYSEKNEDLSNSLLDLELKYKDCLREIEILNRNNKNQLSAQVESYNDVLQVASLRNELMKKELEIEEIKRDYELDLKRYSDELLKSRQKMEVMEDKIENLKYFQYDNEKLKIKIKEFNMFKDKIADYDNLVSCVESKNLQIEKLIQEKQNLLLQNENTIKDLLQEREKLKLIEFEKKKLDYELYDIKKDFSRFEPRRNSSNAFRVPNLRENRHSLMFKSKSKRAFSNKNDIENEAENNTVSGVPLSIINKNNHLNIPGYMTNNNSKVNYSKINNCEKIAENENEEDNIKNLKNFIEIGESRNLAEKLNTERAMGIKNFLSQVKEEKDNKDLDFKKAANTHRDNAKQFSSLIQDEIVKPQKEDEVYPHNKNSEKEKKLNVTSKKQINNISDDSGLIQGPNKNINNTNSLTKGFNKDILKLDLKNINNLVKHEEINLHSPQIPTNNNCSNYVCFKCKGLKNNTLLVSDSDKNVDTQKKEKIKDENINENYENNLSSMSGSSDDSIDQATFNALEAEFFDIKARYQELNESYKEQMESIQKINLEKDELFKINEQNKIEIQNLISMIDKTIIEKEKIEISRQKSEIEYQKILLVIDKLENEKRKFFDENIEIKQKINIMINDKQLLKNEIAEIKKQMKLKSYQIEKLLKEKKDLVNESQKINGQHSPLKNRRVSTINTSNVIKINPKNSTMAVNTKVNSIGEQDLKVEISKLKSQLTAVESENNLLRNKLEYNNNYNSANSNNNNINLNTEDDQINFQKDRSTTTVQTNNNSNKNQKGNNNNFNNISTRKSYGNFPTEPNDTTINSNSNCKEMNNNILFKSKQTSMDYDNVKTLNENENLPSQVNIKNNLISEKQNSNPIIKNSKMKKSSITEFSKNHSNYNVLGTQNTIAFVSPSNKILEKEYNTLSSKNKLDKKKENNESNKLVSEVKGNLFKGKSHIVQNDDKNLCTSKNNRYNQEKINLENNILSTDLEGLIINRDEQEIENEAFNNVENNFYENIQSVEYYKKSIEEHKKIMESEHEIIADSLYDLAVHFLTFKNELLNSIKPTIINNQINMNVNNFNKDNVNNLTTNNTEKDTPNI